MNAVTQRNPEAAARRQAAAAFARWLRAHPSAHGRTLREQRGRSGVAISYSAAYRVAAKLGVLGQCRNYSKYDAFWAQLNWELPNSALEQTWGTWAGNLQQRRVRMGAGPPRWDLRYTPDDPTYLGALAAEQAKAACFASPRPR